MSYQLWASPKHWAPLVRTAAVWGEGDQPQHMKTFCGTDIVPGREKNFLRQSAEQPLTPSHSRRAAAGPFAPHSRGPFKSERGARVYNPQQCWNIQHALACRERFVKKTSLRVADSRSGRANCSPGARFSDARVLGARRDCIPGRAQRCRTCSRLPV